ncbi:inverse autotransporter beta domain-containing protein [Xenorhabdus sp. 42]|uniref:inverse autotransporter beta domain-containing protein n=2 Tax=Xenorhabdus szentirmaii TaxID=290112 RepID=UPI0019B8E61C|nr:inverse autotransporter beta domain-containing protein [Xenorhabdus sp. 42]MBD2822762.1 inverse autotransporter beta domain-containing protein [Xenorhabdus sp. 42]
MDSYIYHKSIRFSVLLYSLLLPMAPTTAFSEEEKPFENKAERGTWLNSGAANTTEKETAGEFAQNIQQVSNILTSSPSQLTDQAKSYALGKINDAISTETHQWLSRYGTARINFSLDRKGKWDNSAVDLLLPLYDNKTDWLFFTQLGYRHQDSRHTLNLGLGGRYFTPNWMYGFNTFFDNDMTGKNKRVGVGGEAWTDYVRLSANTYWRVTEWHQSIKSQDYEERPSNGFDLNSEFYLPAYPNLGGKLAYEQYYGDNVALFNRDTTQKNPSLARIGLNYTPIPLVTMGVDYKYGSGGKSETLFQANLNYRFGTPFSVQLSPSSVASLRTLAGSRYDLVERNNNIVLEYRKKPEFNITLPNPVKGFSGQTLQTNATVISEKPVKPVNWQVDPQFLKNKGVITPRGNQLDVVLPKYNTEADAINDYTLTASADSGDGRQKSAQMKITVEPFVVKDKSIKQSTEGPLVANGQSAYELAASITHGNPNNKPLQDQTLSNVRWYLKPENKNATLAWDKSGKTNDQGQLTATLTSTTPLDKNTQIFLAMDGMRDAKIGGGDGIIDFDNNIKFDEKIYQQPAGPLKGNGEDSYTFKIKVVNAQNEPFRKQDIPGFKWKIKDNKDAKDQVKLVAPENSMTDEEGYLVATLTSHYGFDDIIVEAEIPSSTGDPITLSSTPVKFEAIPQPAGILLKSAVTPGFKKEFPASEQERPHNVHDKLEVYLTRKLSGQTMASPLTTDAADSSEHIQFSVDNKRNAHVDEKTGKVTFPLATWGWSGSKNTPDHKATVTVNITDNTTEAKTIYTYQFNPKHYFYNPNITLKEVPLYKGDDTDNLNVFKTCDTLNSSSQGSPYPAGMEGNSKAFNDATSLYLNSLVNEFGSADPEGAFGIFNKAVHKSENIVVNASPTQTLNDYSRYYLLFVYQANAIKQTDLDDGQDDKPPYLPQMGDISGYLLCLKNQIPGNTKGIL